MGISLSNMYFRRFIDVQVPINTCTLRCQYCYVTHHKLFAQKLPKFKYGVETWRQAFDQDRWGGICMVNFCAAGETLLAPEMVDYIRVTLEQGHYVMVVTNGTVVKAFERIRSEFSPELMSRLFFKFSYHYLQLVERGLLDRFFDIICMMRDAGASFTLELTPHDELLPYIEDLKRVAIERIGAIPHVTVARDEHYMDNLPILTNMNREQYKQVWGQFDSKLFDFKLSIFNQRRCEFCYAGSWTFALDMQSGLLKQCYRDLYSQNILDNPKSAIRFYPIGHYCQEPHCFNGHAWLGFGAIPSFKAPSFAEMRNRVCVDGSEWLKQSMKDAMSTKLGMTNEELSLREQNNADMRMAVLLPIKKFKNLLKKIAHGLK